MHLKHIQNLASNGISLDFETHRLQPGLKAPPAVVGSISWFEEGPAIKGALPGEDSESNLKIILDLFQEVAADSERVLIGANIAMFDLLVAARELAKRGIDIMPDMFKMLSEGRVFDIQIAQALHDIANGILGLDPRTNMHIINPETGVRGRYSLAYCTEILLDRKDAKQNAQYKEKYAELQQFPFSVWPPEALQYPVDDTNNTHEGALAQTGHLPKVSFSHSWKDGVCTECGSTRLSAKCFVRQPHRNLHDLSNQVWTAFAMHMGAARGFRVNQQSVDTVEKHALWKRNRLITPFVEAGIVREDGTTDEAVLKRRVALAYGSKDACPICKGTGKVPSPEQRQLRCHECKGRCQPWKAAGKVKEPTVAFCKVCNNTGKIPHPNPKMIGCVIIDEEGNKTKSCDGSGLLLVEAVPRSDKEGIGKGKDACYESADEFLMSYGEFLEDAKDLKDYIPYLREARVTNPDGSFYDIPLTLRPNPVLETGRTSYNGYIQLFKRKPGYWEDFNGVREYVPSLRECIEARPGYVLASVDYDSGELITHAQSCLWITGYSKLADAINGGLKVHNALGATMINMSYDEFTKHAKSPTCKAARQAAKPGNFGFPGGMGPVKMVHQQRKQGPDTPHPNGPNWIKDEDGKPVRGYKGLRFCILMNGAYECGARKTTEWKMVKIPPTCVECIECAIRLKDLWLQQWPENRKYFAYINNCIDVGQQITGDALERWPWLKEVYAPGTQLAPAEIMQHHSGRIRGGLDYCSAANGFFQGLLGDLAKDAVRQISRECYDKTFRVPTQRYYNSNKSTYAGGPSPLFGSHLIVFQHDEVIPELLESQMHDAATRLSEIMIESMQFYCPDMAKSAKAPPALMRRWYKSAEPVYLNGKLVPWEPAA